MDQPRGQEPSVPPGLPGRLRGRREALRAAAIVAAVALLAGGAAGLILSCCRPPAEAPPSEIVTAPPSLPPSPPPAPAPPAPPTRPLPVAAEPPVPAPTPAAPLQVQVRLATGARRLRVGCAGTGRWSAPALPERAPAAGPWEVSAPSGSLRIGDELLAGPEGTFTPGDGVFELDGRRYRGSLAVRADAQGGLTAMELASVDDYVRGVLPIEMPHYWPREALMAQAVAARTFALYRMTAPDGKRSYLTLADMAYRGAASESPRTDEAVSATAGTVLFYGGAPLPAYFHSTCGGHTSSVEPVFGEKALPPLVGVPCDWCGDSRYYRWKVRMDRSELVRELAPWGVVFLDSIRPLDVDEGGRPRVFLLNGTKQVNATQLRLAVGPNRIRSTSFTAARRGRAFEFTGRGWGHGVGLCQWGACGMALDGKSWRDILAHYYPGAEPQPMSAPAAELPAATSTP